ncbi:MAG: hypothetical protein WAW88_00495, partial [Nocardioides sp.]
TPTSGTPASNTAASGTAHSSTAMNPLVAGVAGGLAGGIVFGLMMQMMGMLPMVAQLVGSSSTGVGWLVHLAISAILGVGYAALLGGRATSLATGLGLGAAWGAVWWVLGALLIMPAVLGMPLFMMNAMTGKSLMGHLIFGALLGAVHQVASQRRP